MIQSFELLKQQVADQSINKSSNSIKASPEKEPEAPMINLKKDLVESTQSNSEAKEQ